MSVPRRGVLHYGHVKLNTDQRKLISNGDEVTLSPIETKLLAVLMERAPRVSPPELLLLLLWPDGEGNWPLLTDVIATLRSKLKECHCGCGLTHIPPFGHRLQLDEPDRADDLDFV